MENSKHLLTVEKFKELARTTSRHVDDEDVLKFIRECEDVYIIPVIGLAKFKELTGDSLSEEDKVLLAGGEYTDKCGGLQRCDGLQIALSYFVYAKMLRTDGAILARTGFMKHEDSYASHIIDKANTRQYNDVMEVAERYLDNSLVYLKQLVSGKDVKPVKGLRTRIKAIGD